MSCTGYIVVVMKGAPWLLTCFWNRMFDLLFAAALIAMRRHPSRKQYYAWKGASYYPAGSRIAEGYRVHCNDKSQQVPKPKANEMRSLVIRYRPLSLVARGIVLGPCLCATSHGCFIVGPAAARRGDPEA